MIGCVQQGKTVYRAEQESNHIGISSTLLLSSPRWEATPDVWSITELPALRPRFITARTAHFRDSGANLQNRPPHPPGVTYISDPLVFWKGTHSSDPTFNIFFDYGKNGLHLLSPLIAFFPIKLCYHWQWVKMNPCLLSDVFSGLLSTLSFPDFCAQTHTQRHTLMQTHAYIHTLTDTHEHIHMWTHPNTHTGKFIHCAPTCSEA